VVVCDDPSAHSSSSEEDTRLYAKIMEVRFSNRPLSRKRKKMTQWPLSFRNAIKMSACSGASPGSPRPGQCEAGELPRWARRRLSSIGRSRDDHPRSRAALGLA